MTDVERAFIDAFHRIDSVPIPGPAIDPVALAARDGSRRRLGAVTRRSGGTRRLLAVAAAFAAVAVALGVVLWQPWSPRIAAVPAATPSAWAPKPQPSVVPPPVLTGVTWRVTDVGGQGVVPTDSGEVPFVVFEDGLVVTGGDPCNSFKSTYRQDGSGLTIADPGHRDSGCGDRWVLEQQDRFWTALERTRQAIRTGDALELLDATGVRLLRLHDELSREPTPLPSAVPPGPGSDVSVRIRNDSARAFDAVEVTFGEGQVVEYGAVPPGGVTEYLPAEHAYRYASITVASGGREFRWMPADYVGESELSPGSYTYALSIVGDDLELVLE